MHANGAKGLKLKDKEAISFVVSCDDNIYLYAQICFEKLKCLDQNWTVFQVFITLTLLSLVDFRTFLLITTYADI